jgi:hypothetical protein
MKQTSAWILGSVLLMGLLATDGFGQAVDPKTLVGNWEGQWRFNGMYRQLSGRYSLSVRSVDDKGNVVGHIESEGTDDRPVKIPALNTDIEGKLQGNRLTMGRDEFTVAGDRMNGERRGTTTRIELTKKK